MSRERTPLEDNQAAGVPDYRLDPIVELREGGAQ